MSNPRTLYEAKLDALCYSASHELHAKLFRTLRITFRIIIGVGGSAAFAGWISDKIDLVGASALVMTIVGVLEQSLDLSERIHRHHDFARRYLLLASKARLGTATVTLENIDQELDLIKADDESGLDFLLVRAQKQVLVAAGHTPSKSIARGLSSNNFPPLSVANKSPS